MKNIIEQYDETLIQVEKLIDELTMLQTEIINASESDDLTIKNEEELDLMYLTIDNAIRLVEEVAQMMVR